MAPPTAAMTVASIRNCNENVVVAGAESFTDADFARPLRDGGKLTFMMTHAADHQGKTETTPTMAVAITPVKFSIIPSAWPGRRYQTLSLFVGRQVAPRPHHRPRFVLRLLHPLRRHRA